MSRALVLTPGDPQGIGPEVACRALVARPPARPVLLVGDPEPVRREAEACGLELAPLDAHDLPTGAVGLLPPPPGPEPVEVRALRWAVAACLDGRAAGLVTGPIHKARLAAQGFAHAGHTDFLGALCGVERPVMAFTGGELRVALVTVHLPLARVPAAVTSEGVLHTVCRAHEALRDQLGLPAPRLVVCGLNPHAGDDGLLGREELEVIGPAVRAARAQGVDARGPVSAEAAFLDARAGRADLVVAMYHDQGLAPLKAVDFGRSVNWTLGMPIVRTSVDHGTADDLVGTGRADPSSMVAALELASQLADVREGRA
ncbi:MAG: 4-hydroxythreonine-4-phosphate dehydrogenase PdxA [Alphaproteobacteria bacterium]|nr:4-hydroxythreonine-4-phosphate dehydrogenase PdxA [Alphaproteobacteria bacterium]